MAAKKKDRKKETRIEKKFVVSLQGAFEKPRTKRAKVAIRLVRDFMKKNFRVAEENIKISANVNKEIWACGREKIPRRISVKTVFDGKNVNVFLQSEKIVEKKAEKKKEEKPKEKTAAEKAMEEEIEKKKAEKREMEKEAEKVAIKRGTK
ncbi:MAG: 60S ribosomal protein L31 [Candidatus Diapherotrites archaeon]|nr:60S ribosomal protein L31 [Candidatus Diapherotrites archaeon]